MQVRTKRWRHHHLCAGGSPFMAELLRKEALCNLPWASPAAGARSGDSRPHPGDTSISLLASPLDAELLRALVGCALGSHHHVACCGTGSLGLLLPGGSMVAAWASSRLFSRFRRVGRAPGSPSESSLFAQFPPQPGCALLHAKGPCCPGWLVHQVTWAPGETRGFGLSVHSLSHPFI